MKEEGKRKKRENENISKERPFRKLLEVQKQTNKNLVKGCSCGSGKKWIILERCNVSLSGQVHKEL